MGWGFSRIFTGYFKFYLNHVDFVRVGKDSVHPVVHRRPRPVDFECVKAVTMGVQTHVDGAWADWTELLVKALQQEIIKREKI